MFKSFASLWSSFWIRFFAAAAAAAAAAADATRDWDEEGLNEFRFFQLSKFTADVERQKKVDSKKVD